MSNRSPFGEALAQYRMDCWLTQKSLAQAMGIAPDKISKLERGDRVPTVEIVEKILTALDQPLEGHWHTKLVNACLTTRGEMLLNLNVGQPQKELAFALYHKLHSMSDADALQALAVIEAAQ